jgi:hypothetical protein
MAKAPTRVAKQTPFSGTTHTAKLMHYIGWRDTTHGNDTANAPVAGPECQETNATPYRGVGTARDSGSG